MAKPHKLVLSFDLRFRGYSKVPAVVEVALHRTMASLHSISPGVEACCSALSRGPKVCTIHLCVENLCLSYIAHEAVHAAYALGRRIGAGPWVDRLNNEEEERIAYPVGEIVAGIVKGLRENGYGC